MNDEYFQRKREGAEKLQAFAHWVAKDLTKLDARLAAVGGYKHVRPNEESADWLAHIDGPDFRITFSRRGYGTKAGQLTVSGSWPTDRAGTVHSPRNYNDVVATTTTITVNEDRPVNSAAKDLFRRLIVPHTAAFLKMKEVAESMDRAADNKKATALQVAAVLGVGLPEADRCGYYHFETPVASVTIRGVDSFEFKADYKLNLHSLLALISSTKGLS